VFLDEKDKEIENLKALGFDIVKKCDGLPLAIKVIGGVLCTKNRTQSDWQAVLSSTLWSTTMLPNDIHTALYLSYEDLPPHLKQCFIYCSLYPEDWEFNSVNLIHLWHAQGFLEVDANLSFWETGLEYYKEMILRNLLEANSNVFDQERCKMHDILWLFGRNLGKNECFITIEGQNLSARSSLIKVRHLSVQALEEDFTAIRDQKSLRSLLLIKSPERNLTDVFNSLCTLRVLDLSFSNISSLPDSLCLLIHLRYFSAGCSSIEMLPNAIGKLKKLEFLVLGGCQNLRHIPESVVNLVELRLLNLYRTEVKGISVGLRKLSNLVELQGFKPHGNNIEAFSSLDELAPLLVLRNLALENMHNVSNSTKASLANLNRKLHLKHLTFKYHGQNVEKETIEDVLNELSPPSSLEHLMIDGYYGCKLPSWLNIGTSLQNLRYLNLRYCAHFQFLALGYLPSLEFLNVENAHSVVNIGTEFLGGNHSSSFPSLQRLIFKGMRNWKIWQWAKEQEAMPNLKELVIRDCPELSHLPDGLSHHTTSLKYLEIINAGKIKVIENFRSLEKLVIYDNSDLKRVHNLPQLRTIWIRDCPDLESLHDIGALRSMVFNVWEDSLPKYLQETKIEKLTVWCSAALLQMIVDEGEEGSERKKFLHIQQANFYIEDKSLYIAYRKAPFSFTSNISSSG
jgi:Leucine-rich repeat (LRR) protein